MPSTKAWAAVITAATALGAVGLSPGVASASSHREAPAISQDPTADNTDLYVFRDPTNATMVDIVANYIGLEQPAAGPLFNNFADDVDYRININNTGTAADDIVYHVRFTTTYSNALPVYNGGVIHSATDPNLAVHQTYSVERDDSTGAHLVASNVPAAPANPGPRSISGGTVTDGNALRDYYEANILPSAVGTLTGGGQVFAGPRKDPFFADLGSIFDLVALRPIQGAHLIPTPGSVTTSSGGTNGPNGGVDGLAGKNVHSIALQLPISAVEAPGSAGTSPATGSIIGVYASAARQRVKVLDIAGGAPRDAGRWVQVSRLGLPLINEVLVPLAQKDRWNGTDPANDGSAGFLGDILDPIPVHLLPVLYGSVFKQPAGTTCQPPGTGPGQGATSTCNVPPGGASNRPDLVALATGQLIGAPASGPGAQAPADLLRINLAPGVATGFPNGRLLADNVVDTELQVLAGVFLPGYGLNNPNHPSHALTDGVNNSADARITNHFPYVGSPVPGYYQPLPGPNPS